MDHIHIYVQHEQNYTLQHYVLHRHQQQTLNITQTMIAISLHLHYHHHHLQTQIHPLNGAVSIDSSWNTDRRSRSSCCSSRGSRHPSVVAWPLSSLGPGSNPDDRRNPFHFSSYYVCYFPSCSHYVRSVSWTSSRPAARWTSPWSSSSWCPCRRTDRRRSSWTR